MKQLLLMRHGKSDWSAEYGSDRERPLSRRGRRAAELMGRFLRQAELAPDLVLTSPARRAQDTASLLSEAGGFKHAPRLCPELYDGGTHGAMEVLRRLDEEHSRVLVIGHQPTFLLLAQSLLRGGDLNLVTAACMCIELETDSWSQLGTAPGQLVWFLPPRLVEKIGGTS